MSKLAFAAFAAALCCATPSLAQDARVRIGERGVTIRSDDGRPRWREERRRDRWVERGRWRDRDVTGSVGCRTITERYRRPDGTRVTRRVERC